MPCSASDRAPVGTVRPSIAMGFGSTVRNSIAKKRKSTNKSPDQTENRIIARIERDQQKLAQLRAAKAAAQTPGGTARATSTCDQSPQTEEVSEKHQPDDREKRVVVKFFFEQLGSPPEEDWSNRDGTISLIRAKMGESAPAVQTVRRTLLRIREEEDITTDNPRHRRTLDAQRVELPSW